MGGAIIDHARTRPTFIEVLTHGEKTNVINRLRDGGRCDWHDGLHEHHLTESEVGEARIEELFEAAEIMGVHGVYVSDFGDGSLTVADVRSRVDFWLSVADTSSLKAPVGNDDPSSVGGSAHPDRQALWAALLDDSRVTDLRGYYVSRYLTGEGSPTSNVTLGAETCQQKHDAMRAYMRWAPDADRYAIGYHSEKGLFDMISGERSHIYDEGEGQPTHDAISPHGEYVESENKTFLVIQGRNLDPYAFTYDHAARRWSRPVRVGPNHLSSDDHGAPALLVDRSGYLHVFYGSHNRRADVEYRRSAAPFDITAWVTGTRPTDNYHTYSFPVLIDDDIYLFYRQAMQRDGSWVSPFVYVKSTDGGNTWSNERKLIDYQADPRTDFFRVYAFRVEEEGGRVHISWALQDEHVTIPHRRNVYHAYLNTNNDQLYGMDGTNYGSTISNITTALVHDSGSRTTNQVRLVLNGTEPHIIFTRERSSGQYQHSYTRWDGGSGAWAPATDITIAGSHFSNGELLFEDGELKAYLAASNNTRGGDIEKWRHAGGQWTKEFTVRARDGYPLNNIVRIRNHLDDLRIVFSEINPLGDRPAMNDLKVFAHGSEGILGRPIPGPSSCTEFRLNVRPP